MRGQLTDWLMDRLTHSQALMFSGRGAFIGQLEKDVIIARFREVKAYCTAFFVTSGSFSTREWIS